MTTAHEELEADGSAGELEIVEPPFEVEGSGLSHEQDIERRIGQGKRVKKGVRKVLVSLHRWVSFVLLVWVIIVSLTGAWLVFGDKFDSLLHSEWYDKTSGDVGPAAAIASVNDELSELKDGAYVYYEVMPTNGRGVYQVSVAEPQDAEGTVEKYFNYYVDPGTGRVNGMRNEEAGFTHWMYRGHEYMWQDHGLFGVFTPGTGWCALDADGAEPGGVKGVVCDVIPDGLDMVAWFGAGLFFILISGFYIWYWPNVRRWATALLIKRRRGRFQFHLSLHNAVGLVVMVPLLIIAFTGMAFAFPNLKNWYENLTPADRGSTIWEAPEDLVSKPIEGAEALDADGLRAAVTDAFPDRTLISIVGPPTDETGTWSAWMDRGFRFWTREGSGGNVYVVVDQYSGEILADATPEDGNVADQLWNDASFPLHAGDFLGTPSRVAWFIVGLSPVLLSVTGVVMWVVRYRRRRKRAAVIAARQAEQVVQPA